MPRKVENARALLASVSNYPLLYTNSRAAYKRSKEKNLLWVNVAQDVFGKTDPHTVNRTKIQWKSIRDAYVKYQKRRLTCSKIRPYVYEKELEFLLPQVLETLSKLKTVERHFLSTDSSGLQEEDSITISSGSESDYNEMEQERFNEEEACEEEPFEEVSIEYISRKKSINENEPDIEYLHKSEDVQEEEKHFYYTSKSRNEHPVDAFFYGIAQTVKQLKPSTISRIKKTVTNMVLNAEAEEFNLV